MLDVLSCVFCCFESVWLEHVALWTHEEFLLEVGAPKLPQFCAYLIAITVMFLEY